MVFAILCVLAISLGAFSLFLAIKLDDKERSLKIANGLFVEWKAKHNQAQFAAEYWKDLYGKQVDMTSSFRNEANAANAERDSAVEAASIVASELHKTKRERDEANERCEHYVQEAADLRRRLETERNLYDECERQRDEARKAADEWRTIYEDAVDERGRYVNMLGKIAALLRDEDFLGEDEPDTADIPVAITPPVIFDAPPSAADDVPKPTQFKVGDKVRFWWYGKNVTHCGWIVKVYSNLEEAARSFRGRGLLEERHTFASDLFGHENVARIENEPWAAIATHRVNGHEENLLTPFSFMELVADQSQDAA